MLDDLERILATPLVHSVAELNLNIENRGSNEDRPLADALTYIERHKKDFPRLHALGINATEQDIPIITMFANHMNLDTVKLRQGVFGPGSAAVRDFVEGLSTPLKRFEIWGVIQTPHDIQFLSEHPKLQNTSIAFPDFRPANRAQRAQIRELEARGQADGHKR